MDDKLVDFKLCVEALGGFSMSRLKDRIEVQKKIYLLQLSGVDLGLWYYISERVEIKHCGI